MVLMSLYKTTTKTRKKDMENAKKEKTKIEIARERLESAKKRVKALQSRESKEARKKETQEKIILGGYLLSKFKSQEITELKILRSEIAGIIAHGNKSRKSLE